MMLGCSHRCHQRESHLTLFKLSCPSCPVRTIERPFIIAKLRRIIFLVWPLSLALTFCLALQSLSTFTFSPATPRYLFTDTNAPASPQRYYRLSYP